MNVATASGAAAGAPDPSAALQAAYDTIRRTRMEGIPILNPAVGVEAVGFRRWRGFWLGVLVTPWCMNLALTEAEPAAWPALRVGEKFTQIFPAGRFEFILGRETLLGTGRRGETLMCSLFSPMFEFANHAGARATALACLDALFDESNLETADIGIGPAPVTLQQDAAAAAAAAESAETAERLAPDAKAAPPAETCAPMPSASRRDFLRGRWTARAAPAPESGAGRPAVNAR
jgi:[NiFe] hydrogenase assembly HybE family chaperone